MKQIIKVCIFAVAAVSIAGSSAVLAQEREAQRQNYLAAKRALAQNQIAKFNVLAAGLIDYPLYPYLQYDYIRSRLWLIDAADIAEFFEQYGDLPVAGGLRAAWLRHLAKQGRWQRFLDSYIPQKNVTLQCYQLQARMRTGNETDLLEDTRTVWLAGESLPPQCDPVFEHLYQSELMTDELIWQRIRLAMQNNKPRLANYLARRLEPEYEKWAQQWIAMHKHPLQGLHAAEFEDTPISREILIHGIQRLVGKNLSTAIERWQALQTQYLFIDEKRARLDNVLAIHAAKRKHPMTVALLNRLDHARVDEEVFHWRLRTALHLRDWHLLKRWTQNQPTEAAPALRWKYWHARALEKTGDLETAKQHYRQLATERDYYGFIAADRVNAPYRMNHVALPPNQAEFNRIANLPAMQRAYEFYQLNLRQSAWREWHHTLNGLTNYQMQLAAILATQWEWHDRAIITLGRARAYDRLVLRFPILYEDLLNGYANKRGLDSSWMLGLVRAESAFIEDVKSPAGALGLMQVMPATGKMTAAKIGLKGFTAGKLKQAATNIQIGSAYLKMMLDRFNGNMVLATAAYNAGPSRVRTWLSQSGACEAPDIWIEKIPYNETRKYVRRVLFFSSIYDWRRRDTIMPISHRMAAVGGDQSPTAESICAGQRVSYHSPL